MLFAGCSQFKRLTPADRLNPDEKMEYLVLLSMDERAARQYATEPSADARTDFLEWFFANSPDAPPPESSDVRERLLKRARQARDFFGTADLFADDRVLTYIRYGPPHREAFEPEPVRDETSRIIVNPAEIWTYNRLGYQFDFVRTGAAYKLVGEARFGPGAVAPALEQVDPDRAAPEPEPGCRSLDLDMASARLRQETDSVEVELSYGIPLAELTQDLEPGAWPLVHARVEFAPRAGGRRLSTSSWLSPNLAGDTTVSRLAVARKTFILPADVYSVTLTATLADGSACGRVSRQLNLIDYVRRAQPGSDVAFYSLADSTFQSVQFERSDWRRLVPMVTTHVQQGGSFYALYELYNLGLSPEGNHEVQADYDIIEETTKQLAVIPTPTRFSSGIGPTATLVERIHTMDLRPGSYILVIRARDLVKKEDVSLTARFQILPGQN